MSPEHQHTDESWQDWHPEKPISSDEAAEPDQEPKAEVGRYLSQTPKEYDLGYRDTTSEKSLIGSSNEVRFIDLKDDGSAIFKPESGEDPELRLAIQAGTYHKRERAAYLVSKFLDMGLVPPTVVREIDGEIGSAQEFIPDANIAKYVEIDKNDQQLKEDLIKLWLFDYIIWNSDRHGGNLLLKESSAIAIDNGLSFGASHLRTFKGFYGLEIPDHIKQIFINVSNEGLLLKILQDLLVELIPSAEAEACVSRIQYLADYLSAEDVVADEFDLPFNPNDDEDLRVADYHPTHDSRWYKRTDERNMPSEPDEAELLAAMAEIGDMDFKHDIELNGDILEIIRMME